MIYVTGDTHGGIDGAKLRKANIPHLYKNLTKDDYVIILGDFGYIWNNVPSAQEEYYLDIIDNKPWTTLFLDGNHENHTRLQSYNVDTWHGGKVHKIRDSIIHLMRGQVYDIEDKLFYVLGGAESIDKAYRIENVSWWRDELLTNQEINEALENAEKIKKVDYVLTHTCPQSWVGRMVSNVGNDPTTKLLDEINNILQYKHWYFGHFHLDKVLDKNATVLYNNIIKLDKVDELVTTTNSKREYVVYEQSS